MQIPSQELADGFTLPKTTCRATAVPTLLTKRAMVKHLDASLGRVVHRMNSSGAWNSTLLIFASDNGGAVHQGGNNYPLRGAKRTNWEGGIRVPAFVAGGFVPATVHGSVQSGLTAGWDWYRTLAGIAQVDPRDRRAEAAHLPPVESHDLWPLISGREATSPRKRIVMATLRCPPPSTCEDANTDYPVLVGGVIAPPYKLVLGESPTRTTAAGLDWSLGPRLQDVRFCKVPLDRVEFTPCGDRSETGCLFNILEDPGERKNLASAMPEVFNRLRAAALEASRTAYSPYRGKHLGSESGPALAARRGTELPFVGPFVD